MRASVKLGALQEFCLQYSKIRGNFKRDYLNNIRKCNVSDEEALAYFNEHISEYTHAPGIVYDAILLEILDMQDASEVAAKKPKPRNISKNNRRNGL